MAWDSDETSRLRSTISSLRTLLAQSEDEYEKLLTERNNVETVSKGVEGACEIFLRDQHKVMQICKQAGVDIDLHDGEVVDVVVALRDLLDEERAENNQFRSDIEYYRLELYGEEPLAETVPDPVTSSTELGWNDVEPVTSLCGGYPVNE